MSLFAIGDTHLSFGVEKPMDVFRGWSDYEKRLEENWHGVVSPEDTVLICGDVSWALKLSEALPDLRFLQSLPGSKLLMKGNHDYWWETRSKMEKFLADNSVTGIDFLYNNAFSVDGIAVAGTKGWFYDSGAEDEAKALNRECCRLRLSLQKAAELPGEKVAFLHYPPLSVKAVCRELIDILHEFGITRCYYAHLHGAGGAAAYEGDFEGVDFRLISADRLGFMPKLICKSLKD